jgi:hypothetical protein
VSATQVELVAKFAAGVVDTGVNFATGVNDTGGAPCTLHRKFSKKFDMTLMLFSGAWEKVIHEKNLKQKISRHCPFKKLLI